MNLSLTWDWFINNIEWFLVIAVVWYSTKVNTQEKYYEKGYIHGYNRARMVFGKGASR